MQRTITSLLLISVLALPSAASAARKAEAVSPGAVGSIARIEASCPTFSWGAVRGAAAYEIVIYQAEGDRNAADSSRPMVRTVIPGSALAWTPSLGSCLERGRTYAWVVRAIDQENKFAWSEPRLFRVEPTPSKAEIEDALTLLRRYVGKSEEELVDAGSVESKAQLPTGLDTGSELQGTAEIIGSTINPDPFTVDEAGNVFGATFYGSGGGLSGVNASFLRNKTPASFADGTHSHPGLDQATDTVIPEYVRYGTAAAVLTGPIMTFSCSGAAGATSTCDASCPTEPPSDIPASWVRWRESGGGCVSEGGTCADTGRAVTASHSLYQSWKCSTACNDGVGGTTGATGYVVCVVSYN